MRFPIDASHHASTSANSESIKSEATISSQAPASILPLPLPDRRRGAHHQVPSAQVPSASSQSTSKTVLQPINGLFPCETSLLWIQAAFVPLLGYAIARLEDTVRRLPPGLRFLAGAFCDTVRDLNHVREWVEQRAPSEITTNPRTYFMVSHLLADLDLGSTLEHFHKSWQQHLERMHRADKNRSRLHFGNRPAV